MSFIHLDAPPERHSTRAATESLSALLGFNNTSEIQDWERHFQDFDRLEEFIKIYEFGQIDENEKFLLMELILASASDGDPEFPNSKTWMKIEELLRKEFDIHAWSVWSWSCIDEESHLPYNDFVLSPYLQALLLGMASTENAGSVPDLRAGDTPSIQFGKFWWKYFETCSPFGHQLRQILQQRWVRFHSLPESKRYPESESERQEVFDRATTLANEVLGNGSRCWLIVNRFLDAPLYEPDPIYDFNLDPCLTWMNYDEPLEAVELVTYAGIHIWQPDRFKSLLNDVALGKESQVLFVSEDTHSIFAPYDGGIDLILPDSNIATALAVKHCTWLSPFPSGL